MMSDYYDTDREPLGIILRKHRKENGYTQQRIADYLGLDRSTYAKYESSRKPELDIIIQLSALYGISVDDLLGDYSEEAVKGKKVKQFAKASSPENSDGSRLTRDELKLLALFRKSIRKNDILGYAHRIASEDIKAAEKNEDN